MRNVILIVEDNSLTGDEYAHRLKAKGYIPVQARTAEQAWQLFTANRGKLAGVIVDDGLGSTQLNTLSLIKQLRRAAPGLKIIAAPLNHGCGQPMVNAGCDIWMSKQSLNYSLAGHADLPLFGR